MSRLDRFAVGVSASVLVMTSLVSEARAQGCIVARQSADVAGGGAFFEPGQWQLALASRWFRSSRHFVGTHEQTERATDGTQTPNDVMTFALEASYALSKRAWLSATLPYFIGERSEPVYAADQKTVVARSRTSARGVGDVIVGARAWVLDPERFSHGNVALGLGLKLPTGQDEATSAVVSATGPTEVRTVDPSIQPGDGGLGLVLSLQAFQEIAKVSLYASATYLVSPRETNGVPTFRPRASEAFASVPDAYLARTGATLSLGRGVSVGLGARFEGTPVNDLVGGSDGFRRPGYTLSIEPSAGYATGPFALAVSVPAALVRNRQQSEPERRDGVQGDAAFADVSILLGVTYRFAAPTIHEPMHQSAAAPMGETTTFGELPLALHPVGDQARLGEKLTVVNLWATWCQPCRDEIPLLNAIAARFADRGVTVVGVSLDDAPGEIARFRREVPMAYPTFWAGPDAAIPLGEGALPTTLVLDARGAVVSRLRGVLSPGVLDAKLSALLGEAGP